MGRLGMGVKVLVLVGGLVWIGREIHTIYEQSQPPVAGTGEAVVSSDLPSDVALDLELYISTKSILNYPPPKNKVLGLTTFAGVLPAWSGALQDVKVNVTIPANMRLGKDMNLYIFVFAVNKHGDANRLAKSEGKMISRNVTLQNQKYPTRNLLEHPTPLPQENGRLLEVEAVTGLPRVIEVGFVVEERALSLERLRAGDAVLHEYLNHGSPPTLRLPLFLNTLVSPRDEYADVNGSFEMEVRFRNVGLALFTMQRILLAGFDDAEQMMKINAYDLDSFKQLITGSAPWKFIVVYGVAILHLIFGYLALSADLSYWRGRTSFEGMSARSITLGCISNFISLAYVMEIEQSKLAVYMVAGKFALNAWKLTKITRFERVNSFPFVAWRNKLGASQTLEEFEELDGDEYRCMRNLFICLSPLIIAFGAYRLVHQPFRSWYSWGILTLAVASQTAGFVIMTPQLFINYRLKSVEHLPWKALSYQAVNTFIDDIFTLCIRMPEVQKYSVFRDDIVFLICCYQRWLYSARRKVEDEVQAVDEKEVAEKKEN